MRVLASGLLVFVAAAGVDAGIAQSGSSGTAGAGSGTQRLICRRSEETGSLARTRRQCYTRAEWDRLAESSQTGAQRMVEGSSRPAVGRKLMAKGASMLGRSFVGGLCVGLASMAATAIAQPSGSRQSSQRPADEVICRMIRETGSFARRRRDCFTRAQWEQMAQAARRNGEYLQTQFNPPTPPCHDPETC